MLKVNGLRNPVAQIKRFLPDAVAKERIVGRSLRGRIRDRVHPDDLAEQVVQTLSVAAVRVVAVGRVEFAVQSKMQSTAVVIRGAAQVVEVEQHHFTHARVDDIAIGSKSADPVVNRRRRRGVVDVDELVAREVRIEGKAEQLALAGRIDAECQKRRRQQHTVLDHAQLTTLLCHEQPAIRRKIHGGGIGKAVHHRHVLKPRREARGRPGGHGKPARDDDRSRREHPDVRARGSHTICELAPARRTAECRFEH